MKSDVTSRSWAQDSRAEVKSGGFRRELMNPVMLAILVWFPLTAKDQPARPKITGIAHVRVYSTNLDNSRKFYGKIIALAPGTPGCAGRAQSCFAVNDHQQIEIISASTPANSNFLAEVALTTNDVGEMRRYLIAHCVTAGAISKDANGAQHFELLDPEGHPIAFVQQAARTVFKPSADQLSTRLFHAGFVVRDSGVEDRFYRDLPGFRMYCHGGFKESDTRKPVHGFGDQIRANENATGILGEEIAGGVGLATEFSLVICSRNDPRRSSSTTAQETLFQPVAAKVQDLWSFAWEPGRVFVSLL